MGRNNGVKKNIESEKALEEIADVEFLLVMSSGVMC